MGPAQTQHCEQQKAMILRTTLETVTQEEEPVTSQPLKYVWVYT